MRRQNISTSVMSHLPSVSAAAPVNDLRQLLTAGIDYVELYPYHGPECSPGEWLFVLNIRLLLPNRTG